MAYSFIAQIVALKAQVVALSKRIANVVVTIGNRLAVVETKVNAPPIVAMPIHKSLTYYFGMSNVVYLANKHSSQAFPMVGEVPFGMNYTGAQFWIDNKTSITWNFTALSSTAATVFLAAPANTKQGFKWNGSTWVTF